ncbi:MAG: 2-dehydropantoate 2-reductase [Rhodobacteraceae bacterium]|nr:MAG: 2-dehydropantoate 2-reductase [Paracoccaceae bacterium]
MNLQKAGHAPHIVIAGAGSIGCFTGGLLAAANHNVTLLARPRIISDIRTHGLTLSDFYGLLKRVAPDDLTLTPDPECLRDADLILVTVKTGASAEMAQLIASHAPATTPVISLQNGLEAVQTLRAGLPDHPVRAAMVPFNVVPRGPGEYHRASSGDIMLETGAGGLGSLLSAPGLRVPETPDITAYQWGKVLVNLANALNALSGLTLQDMLMSRDWRRLMADQMAEAVRVLRAAGIATKSTTPLPMAMIPHVLRLPTPLFARIAAQMLTIDPSARTSMAYDLDAGRGTEIDSLQGVIIALGQTYNVVTPICTRVAQAVRDAAKNGPGSPRLTPAQLHSGASP